MSFENKGILGILRYSILLRQAGVIDGVKKEACLYYIREELPAAATPGVPVRWG